MYIIDENWVITRLKKEVYSFKEPKDYVKNLSKCVCRDNEVILPTASQLRNPCKLLTLVALKGNAIRLTQNS